MTLSPELVHSLSDLLVRLGRIGYVVAKNPSLWANLERGGDWDLVVTDLSAAGRSVTASLGTPLRVECHTYVHAYFYGWGEIDLLAGVHWRGVELLSASDMIRDASVGSDGVMNPSIAHEAVAAWIAPLLSSATFKPTYAGTLQRAASTDAAKFVIVLRRIFGKRLSISLLRMAARGSPEDSLAMTRTLRRVVVVRALLTQPLKTTRNASHFGLREINMRWHPPTPWLEVTSCEQVDAAESWAARQGRAIPGVLLVTTKCRAAYHVQEVAFRGERHTSLGAPEQRTALGRRWWLATRQSRGWLVVILNSGGAGQSCSSGAVRRTRSALSGRPIVCPDARDVETYLSGELARHTRRVLMNIGGPTA